MPRRRRRALLLISVVAVLVLAALAVVLIRDHRRAVARSGLVEVRYSTTAPVVQDDVARSCHLTAVARLTDAQVRYRFDPQDRDAALGCVRRSPRVVAVAIPG